MPTFASGEVKTAKVRMDVDPVGASCLAELWLSRDGVTKDATSGAMPFVSTGDLQDISLPVTMPGGGYLYGVYLDIKVGGVLVGAYRATEDVIVPSVSEPIITW